MATLPNVNDEIARTQKVIADRLNAGQDLTSQLAHYKNLTGNDYTKTGDYQKLQSQKGVNDIYNQQVSAATQLWNAQRDKQIGDINYQKQQVAPQYQGLRNQNDVVNLQNSKRLQELMASRGLGASGENVTATVNQNNARQNSLNTLNAQEQQTLNDFDHQIANINNPAELNAQLAQINAQRNQALLDNTWKQKEFDNTNYWNGKNYGLSEAGLTGMYNGQSTIDKVNSDRNYNLDLSGVTGYLNGKPTMQKTISDREWNQMSPADKQRMALQYAYSQKGKSSGGGSSSKKASSSAKTSSKSAAKPLPSTPQSQSLQNNYKLYQNIMANGAKGKTSTSIFKGQTPLLY